MPRTLALATLVLLAARPAASQTDTTPRPPVARIVPRADTTLGDVRIDNYAWLRDDRRQDTAVIHYLEAENRYTEAVLRHTAPLQERLFQEMRGRIQETDLSVPERIGEYLYYSRTEAGKQYPIHARRRGPAAPEEVLLDVNRLAEGKRYFSLGAQQVSPDARLLAFAADTSGAERYTLMVKELATGRILADRIPGMNGDVEWAADNRTLFYATSDAANRPYRVMRHVLGTDPSADAVAAEEPDELYRLGIARTKDRRFLLVSSTSYDAAEVRYLAADRPMDAFRVIRPRTAGVLYEVEHRGDRFLITTNEGAPNFKLVWAPDADPRRERWRELVPASDSVLLDGTDVFRDYLVLYQRQNALRRIHVIPFAGGQPYDVDFPEPIYTFRGGRNPDYEARVLRFTYTSLVTPPAVYDYDLASRTRRLMKATEVPGYDPSLYASERTWARRAGRHAGAHLPRLPEAAGARRVAAAAAVRLRLVRHQHRPGVQHHQPEPARPRRGLRHRAHPRRTGDGPAVVRPGQAAEQAEHLHRLHRLRRAPGGRSATPAASAWRSAAAARAGC